MTEKSPPSLDNCEQLHISRYASPRKPEGPTEGDREDAREALLAGVSRDSKRRVQVDELIRQDDPAHAKRLASCGRQSVELECGDCGGSNYVPISCDSRLCADCMQKRMGELIGKYAPAIAGSWSRPTLLTLTVPNVEDAVAGKERVQEAFGRFRRRVVPVTGESKSGQKRWAWKQWMADGPVTDPWRGQVLQGRGREFVEAVEREYVDEDRGIPMDRLVRGGLYGIDIKQQSTERFHVHIHALVDMAYVPQPALAEVWRDVTGATGEAGEIVDVRRIRGGDREEIEDALAEVTGYVTKPPEFESVEDEVEVMLALKGSRLVQPFGELHGRTVEETAWLLCSCCDRAPERWEYLGVIDKVADEIAVETQGDRPPPGTGPAPADD